MTGTVIVDVFDWRHGTACSRLFVQEDGGVGELKGLWDSFFSARERGVEYGAYEFHISFEAGRELFDAVLVVHKRYLAGLNDLDVRCCTTKSLRNLEEILKRSDSLAVSELRRLSWAEAVQ